MLKMRAVTLLVLLLPMCGSLTLGAKTEVHTESHSSGAAAAAAEVSTQLDVSAELRELREMVGELRATQSFTPDEHQNTKYLLNKMEAENDAVKKRLVASETKVEALERVNLAQEAEMTAVKTDVINLIKEHAAQEAEMTAVKTRLAASETEVVNLRKEARLQTADLRSVTERVAAIQTDIEAVKNDTAAQQTDLTKEQAAQEAELTAVKTRLAATETNMEAVKNDTAAQHTDLTTMKTEVMNLTKEHTAQEAELTAVKTRLAATETEVVNLEKEITETPKVAFSAGLTNSGFIEAVNTDLNLVFTNTITNVGRAYSNINGLFTAPVRGVYYFRFTVCSILSSKRMYIKMLKNGEQVMWLGEYDTDGQYSYLSSGVTLQLEVGDVVNMQLPKGYRLYDNSHNNSIFSGFLLFPL